jgi:hypothetical protein
MVMLPPLPSLLIFAGLLILSVMIVHRAKKAVLLGKYASRALLWCGLSLLALGFILQIGGPPAGAPRAAAPRQAAPDGPGTSPATRPPGEAGTSAPAPRGFSFEPQSVRWGEEVRIRVFPGTEKITVYYNGRPLPSRAREKGIFVVTIPAVSKSGYFVVDCGGTKLKAEHELVVRPD